MKHPADNANDVTDQLDIETIQNLRVFARSCRHAKLAADDLVDQAMQTAISEIRDRPANLTLTEWLGSILLRSV